MTLTIFPFDGIVVGNGEMSERFKELVLKTSDGATHRGFESHSLRQKSSTPWGGTFLAEWDSKGR